MGNRCLALTAVLAAALVVVLALAPPAQAGSENTVVALVVVDGATAGSSLGWFTDVLQAFDTRFPLETNNKLSLEYGLLVANPAAQTFDVEVGSGGTWGSFSDVTSALGTLPGTGVSSVDGFLGIESALQMVPGGYAGQTVILLTTGERVDWGGSLFGAVSAVYGKAETYVNAIVDHGFGTAGVDPEPGPTMGARGITTWHATAGDTATPLGNGVARLGGPGFAYANFILDYQAGSVWSVNAATDPGLGGSFRRGFTDVKVNEFSGAGAPIKDAVIPEPGTALLLGVAGGLLLVLRRKR